MEAYQLDTKLSFVNNSVFLSLCVSVCVCVSLSVVYLCVYMEVYVCVFTVTKIVLTEPHRCGSTAGPRGWYVIALYFFFLPYFFNFYSVSFSLFTRSRSLLHILSTFILPTRCKISTTFPYLLMDKTYKTSLASHLSWGRILSVT